jgi:hypothetical protein
MKLLSQATVVAIALLGAMQANAASVTYQLDQSNDLADGPIYGTVTISDGVAGNIDFSVAIDSGAFPTPLSNFGMQAFYFNYDNSLTVSASNITAVIPNSWAIAEDRNAGGGFGKFEFVATGSGSTRTSVLTFSISGVAGDTIADYAVGYADDTTEFFAAHIAGYSSSMTGNTSGKFAGSTVVPVPAAIWLFGSALGMLAWSRRRPA